MKFVQACTLKCVADKASVKPIAKNFEGFFIFYFVFDLFFHKGFHRQVVSKENSPATKIQIKLQYTKFFGEMQKRLSWF